MDFYKEVGRRIKYYRDLKGVTLEYIGDKIGVGKSTVRKYENGLIRIDHNRLSDIAKVLGIDVSLLYGDEVQFETVDVPLYGEISCGDGSVIYEEVENYITTPKSWVSNDIYFYVTATGDSMVGAKVNEGDLLLIRQQPTVENGEIAAVVIDDEIVLKRVYRENGKFTLISENPKYPPITFNPEQDKHIRVLGKLKKSITEY